MTAGQNDRRVLKKAAFFDLDDTIIHGSSGLIAAKNMLKRKMIKPKQVGRAFLYAALFRFNRLDYSKMLGEMLSLLKGIPEDDIIALSKEIFEDIIKPIIYEDIRDIVRMHKSHGDTLVIVSSSWPHLIKEVADFLDFDDQLATEYFIDENHEFTGDFSDEMAYGAGKRRMALKYAGERGIDMGRSYFYSDSSSDIPLLLTVGNPVLINPDYLLARAGRKRNWPAYHFKKMLGSSR